MDMDIIHGVVEEFTKRLQLPESKYTFAISSSNELTELIITVEDTVKYSIGIGNGTIKVVYTDEYNSDQYLALSFLTPITLLYHLCILFFAATKDISTLDFNKLMSVLLLDNIYDWKTLIRSLSENLGMSCEIYEDYVDVEQSKIRYIPYLNEIHINDIEIKLDDGEYTTIVEAMFKCVEYIANILDTADNLFNIEEDNVMEGQENMENPEEENNIVNMDVDIEDTNNGEPAPVEPMETETFEEPQSPVVTMDDLI